MIIFIGWELQAQMVNQEESWQNHACMETHRDYRVTGKREINKKNDPWISPQFPDSVQEERIKLAQTAEIAHKKDKKTKCKITHNALYINRQRVIRVLLPLKPVSQLMFNCYQSHSKETFWKSSLHKQM